MCIKNIKKNIRNFIRNQRKKLTEQERNIYSNNLTNLIFKNELVRSSLNFGLFLSFDGEINTNFLIKRLFLQNKKIYLPAINYHNNKELIFMEYNKNTILKKNSLNFFEPISSKNIILVENLDILFVPLVAFDKKGYRLGMGGGFYDKILNNSNKHFYPIGLGYDFQLINKIPIEPWDRPLPKIIFASKK